MSDSDSISDSESASDLESDYEEVSHYMTLHFDMPEEYKDVALENYQLTGLETSTPFLKVNDLLFRGRYEQALGTDLLLKHDHVSTNASRVQRPEDLQFVGRASRRILFERVKVDV